MLTAKLLHQRMSMVLDADADTNEPSHVSLLPQEWLPMLTGRGNLQSFTEGAATPAAVQALRKSDRNGESGATPRTCMDAYVY